MANPQHAILTNLDEVPVVHAPQPHRGRRSRRDQEGHARRCAPPAREVGVTTPVNVCLLFGPTLLADLTDDVPDDFQPYPGYESPDGKVAKGTQEELLLWVHSDDKDLCWETQFNFRNAVAGPHDRRPRDADVHLPQQPRPHRLHRRHRQPRAGGPARPRHRPRRPAGRRRLVLHRPALGARPRLLQRPVARRTRRTPSVAPRPTRPGSTTQVPTSHLSHVELRDGDDRRRQQAQARRDGAPLDAVRLPRRHRRPLLHGLLQDAGADARAHGGDLRHNGQERDALTDYSTPASGSFYFAPSAETLDAALA